MIEAFIERNPGCTHKDLLTINTGCKKNFLYQVKALADEGKVIRIRENRKGYRYYALTVQEKQAIEQNIPLYKPIKTLYNPRYIRQVKSVFDYV